MSDDTLIKQINSRAGDKNFGFESYASLPDVINQPERIFWFSENERIKFFFLKQIKDKWAIVVMKYLPKNKETFAESFYFASEKNASGLVKKYEEL